MKIVRVLANNPGPFTGPGTNTWLVDDGNGQVVVIDPGPIDSAHRAAIEAAVAGRRVWAVLVTHTHPDHAPLANPIATDLSVPALGYGPGPGFEPDVLLKEGSRVEAGSLRFEVIHTPGHSDDHLCFRAGGALFSGDHIMGGSSVMVESMGSYLRSLEKLRGTGLERIHPGHGDEMDNPDDVIDWYVAHRLQRHEEILSAIRKGADSVPVIVETVYQEVDKSLHPLAAMSVRAHLGLLMEEGRIAFQGDAIVPRPPLAK